MAPDGTPDEPGGRLDEPVTVLLVLDADEVRRALAVIGVKGGLRIEWRRKSDYGGPHDDGTVTGGSYVGVEDGWHVIRLVYDWHADVVVGITIGSLLHEAVHAWQLERWGETTFWRMHAEQVAAGPWGDRWFEIEAADIASVFVEDFPTLARLETVTCSST